MIYTHTIGRIGKDCRVITGTHGTFMSVDIAVDDYSKGQNITTWVRVRSSRENLYAWLNTSQRAGLFSWRVQFLHPCGLTGKARATFS